MTYVFLDSNSTVVNTVLGPVSSDVFELVFAQQKELFGADRFIVIDSSIPVWIGGQYNEVEGFIPPEVKVG